MSDTLRCLRTESGMPTTTRRFLARGKLYSTTRRNRVMTAHSGPSDSMFQKMVSVVLKEEVLITGINNVVGWLIYNVLIGSYGFSWPHAVEFGLIGYGLQIAVFRAVITWLRGRRQNANS